ncbi:Letm1 RBD domain-containing protein [Flavobacterium longum]|uniref:LETM1-related biofilm-associated protein n=1 Tax=Flavobacterium longum TaxID=1299340 RepID=UPI0039EBF916
MINPSAHGWIDKFFLERQAASGANVISAIDFYRNTRKTGFVYGHVISLDTPHKVATEGWLPDEWSKVALLNSLYGIYCATTGEDQPAKFVVKTVAFYNAMHPGGLNFFKKVFAKAPASQTLESMIDDRVQTNHDIVSKNFSHFVTNALLFMDVLAFQHYLKHHNIGDKYLKTLEEAILGVVSYALKAKTVISPHDDLLIKLLEASVRYNKLSKGNLKHTEMFKLDAFQDDLEKYYVIDLASMTLWTDGKVENEEAFFMHKLGESLHVPETLVTESMAEVRAFIDQHRKEIAYFSNPNPVKNFYDHITQSVVTLITRNRNRLVKEISQSKELMVLLAQSTQRDLDDKEKKKVKTQLLDICKSIPAMTIFLLPGGTLLLPILIKFIPKMLPSAFNENLEE